MTDPAQQAGSSERFTARLTDTRDRLSEFVHNLAETIGTDLHRLHGLNPERLSLQELGEHQAALETLEGRVQRFERLLNAMGQQAAVQRPFDYSRANILLLSSSKTPGNNEFLAYAGQDIRELFGAVDKVTFVAYAEGVRGLDAYTNLIREKLKGIGGFDVAGVHAGGDPKRAIAEAQAIFIGGGNTHWLLDELYRNELIPIIRERVEAGVPLLGSSAGTNVASFSIMTTNDMPASDPPLLDALNILPFRINPHYIDTDQNTNHRGETRKQRLEELLAKNSGPVVALREGGMLRLRAGHLSHQGDGTITLFRNSEPPLEIAKGADLDFLL